MKHGRCLYRLAIAAMCAIAVATYADEPRRIRITSSNEDPNARVEYVERSLSDAHYALIYGRVAQARLLLEQCVTTTGANALYQKLVLDLLSVTGDRTLLDLLKGYDLQLGDPGVRLRAAYLGLVDADSARAIAVKSLESFDEDERSLALLLPTQTTLAIALARQEFVLMPFTAEHYAEQAVRLSPSSCLAHHALAISARQRRIYPRALHALEQAIELAPPSLADRWSKRIGKFQRLAERYPTPEAGTNR